MARLLPPSYSSTILTTTNDTYCNTNLRTTPDQHAIGSFIEPQKEFSVIFTSDSEKINYKISIPEKELGVLAKAFYKFLMSNGLTARITNESSEN